MNHPSGRAPDGDLTAKARIRNAALELYAANGEDRTSMRAVSAENPEIVDYLRRALLETGTARGHLLERLTELTHREVVAMRESGAASRGRPDSVQVIDVLVNQLGRLFLQPLVDSAWSHLGNFTHTDDRNKPELTVQSRGDRPGGKPAGAPTDDPDSAPDGPQ